MHVLFKCVKTKQTRNPQIPMMHCGSVTWRTMVLAAQHGGSEGHLWSSVLVDPLRLAGREHGVRSQEHVQARLGHSNSARKMGQEQNHPQEQEKREQEWTESFRNKYQTSGLGTQLRQQCWCVH